MMMNTRKTRLAMAVAGAVTLTASTAQAETFTASGAVAMTLAVTSLVDLNVGTLFATVTGGTTANGVAALVIGADGTVTDPTDSASVSLTSLGAPTVGQGSVDMITNFTLTFPDTDNIDVLDFEANAVGGADSGAILNITSSGIELAHESGNSTVPSLWLMHFEVTADSGGTISAADNDGIYEVLPGFGDTTFVFNIGATVTTEPSASVQTYQEGNYIGTYEVTAAY